MQYRDSGVGNVENNKILKSNRVIGIDPGSRYAGIAVVEDDVLLFSYQKILDKGKTSDDLAKCLYQFEKYIYRIIIEYYPSLLVVEHTSVARNMTTTKLLTYFESAALIAAGHYGILAERVRTKQARKIVMGNGNATKDDIRDWTFRKYDKMHGYDEAEAIIFALYGQSILREA
jgi:Holliday junction resolvasome RuvABC endonuclease subunit